MDSKLIEDQHIVARYLADQLPDAEREAFEAYCLEHPEMFRQIEAAARLKGGLAKLEESGALGAILEKPVGFGNFVWRHAASLAAIGVGVAVLVAGVYSLRVPAIGASLAQVSGRFRSALPLAAQVSIERKRDSATVDKRVPLPSIPSAIELRVLPDVENGARYTAILSEEVTGGSREVAKIRGLVPGDDRFVSFFVNSQKLKAGTYLLTISPEDSGSGDADSGFRIAFESKQ